MWIDSQLLPFEKKNTLENRWCQKHRQQQQQRTKTKKNLHETHNTNCLIQSIEVRPNNLGLFLVWSRVGWTVRGVLRGFYGWNRLTLAERATSYLYGWKIFGRGGLKICWCMPHVTTSTTSTTTTSLTREWKHRESRNEKKKIGETHDTLVHDGTVHQYHSIRWRFTCEYSCMCGLCVLIFVVAVAVEGNVTRNKQQ